MDYAEELNLFGGIEEILKYMHDFSSKINAIYSSFKQKDIIRREYIENYILKNYFDGNPQTKEIMINYIAALKNAASQDFSLFSKTSLLKSENIEFIFGKNSKIAEEIAYYEEQFNREAYRLFKESQKRELNDDEKTVLASFFNYTINTTNPNIKKAQLKYLTKLLLKETLPKNDEEIKFIVNSAKKYICEKHNENGMDVGMDVNVYISNLSDHFRGRHIPNHSLIFINHERSHFKDKSENIIKTLFHELRHEFQKISSSSSQHKYGNVMEVAYDYAVIDLMCKYIGRDAYNRGLNYWFQEHEIDAQTEGYRNAGHFYYHIRSQINLDPTTAEAKKLKEIGSRLFEKSSKIAKENNYHYRYIETSEGKYFKEKFNVIKLNEIIKKHPSELDRYPILRRLYNSDGTEKKLDDLIRETAKNTSDVFYPYKDSIMYHVCIKDELKDIRLSNYPPEAQYNFLRQLTNIFDEEKKTIALFAEPESEKCFQEFFVRKYKYTKNHEIVEEEKSKDKIFSIVSNTSAYHFKNMAKIGNFIMENYELFVSLCDEYNPSACGVRHFQTDVFELAGKILPNVPQNLAFKNIASEELLFYKKMRRDIAKRDLFIKLNKDYGNGVLSKQIKINSSGATIPIKKYIEESFMDKVTYSNIETPNVDGKDYISAFIDIIKNRTNSSVRYTSEQLDKLSFSELEQLSKTGRLESSPNSNYGGRQNNSYDFPGYGSMGQR